MEKSRLKTLADSNNWWSGLSEDDKIFIMMKYGYDNPFNPNRVTMGEVFKIYKLENI